jgi:hypothetical protein
MAFPVPYTPALSRRDSMPYRRCEVVRVSLLIHQLSYSLLTCWIEEHTLHYEYTPLR